MKGQKEKDLKRLEKRQKAINQIIISAILEQQQYGQLCPQTIQSLKEFLR